MAKILSNDSKEFSKIEKKLQSLPEEVSLQIKTAESSLLGIQCTLRDTHNSNKIYLPRPIDQFMIRDDKDTVMCGDFCFIIHKKASQNIHYIALPS